MILLEKLLLGHRVLFSLATVCVLVLLIYFFKKAIKRREKKKEIAMAAADRMRDENLNHVILNSHKDDNKEVYTPYDVAYSGSDKGGRKRENKADVPAGKNGKHLIQLVENTELSTRKFVLNPAKVIRIGSTMEDNDITVFAEGVAPRQCEIFAAGGKIYIRDMGEGRRTILKRKKEQAIVDGRGVRLLSGDSILFGSVSYDVTFVE